MLKQTVTCVTKTARNVHFGSMKFTWRKKTACYLCEMLSNLFESQDIFTIDFGRHYAMLKTVELHGPTKQYKTVIIC